jgi:hypothetical protein
VVDAVTGEPVADATVTLNWVSAEAAASSAPVVRTPLKPGELRPGVQVTNESGRFEYTGLTAGRFRLQVRGGPGYRWSYFGMQTPWDTATGSTQHELRSSERLTDIELTLWPSGSISGTVRDEFDEPIVKASLRLFERPNSAMPDGWVRTTVSATTDDRGHYSLGGRSVAGTTLPGPGAGDYVIVVTAPRSGPDTAPAFAGAVFSGGTRSATDAQVISLGIGEHRTDVDVVVSTKPGSTWVPVRGRIVNHTVLREPLRLRLTPSDASGELANFLEIAATAGTDGRFSFPEVPPGQYRLRAWQFPEGVSSGSPPLKAAAGPTWLVDVPVDVDAAGPVEDRLITLHAAARISGRITFDGDSPPPAIREVRLAPREDYSDLTVGTVRTHVDAASRFVTPGLLPGQYLVSIDTGLLRPDRPFQQLWWPSSIHVEGRAVGAGTIDLGMSDIDLAITLTDRRAVITGTVRDRRNQSRPDARVVVFGRDPASAGGCLRIIAPDRFGGFEYSSYSRECVLAAVLAPPRDWRAPEYLQTLRPFAMPAVVELGQTRTIDLTVRP